MLLEAYSPGLGTKGSLGCDLKLLRIDGCPFNQRAVGHAVRSILDEVPGVGPAKKRALLRKFGSVKGMRAAAAEELAAVPGVGPKLAERIREAISTSEM